MLVKSGKLVDTLLQAVLAYCRVTGFKAEVKGQLLATLQQALVCLRGTP